MSLSVCMCMFLCVCMLVHVHVHLCALARVYVGHRTAWDHSLLPLWILKIELRSQGLCAQCLYLLTDQQWALIFVSCLLLFTSVSSSADGHPFCYRLSCSYLLSVCSHCQWPPNMAKESVCLWGAQSCPLCICHNESRHPDSVLLVEPRHLCICLCRSYTFHPFSFTSHWNGCDQGNLEPLARCDCVCRANQGHGFPLWSHWLLYVVNHVYLLDPNVCF